MAQDEVVLKISAKKDPGYAKRVAGAMTWRLREAGWLRARAVKQEAVNTAIKAIAICNQRVAAASVVLQMDLSFSPSENDGGKPATAIEMFIKEVDAQKPANFVDYKVSGKTSEESDSPSKLALAVAQAAKDGNGITMRCIGPAAVYKGVMASTMARGTMFSNGFDTVIVPSWETAAQEDGSSISLIRIDFWPIPLRQNTGN